MFDAIRFHSRLNPEPGLVAFDSTARELSYADIAGVDAATDQLKHSALSLKCSNSEQMHGDMSATPLCEADRCC